MATCVRCTQPGRAHTIQAFGRVTDLLEPHCPWHAALTTVALTWTIDPDLMKAVYDASAGRMGPGLDTYHKLPTYALKRAVTVIMGHELAGMYLLDKRFALLPGERYARQQWTNLVPFEARQ